MPRRPRLHVPGGFYHVTLRGNHRQPIFFTSADRTALNALVSDALDRFAARLHAYCWMPNHIHMLIQVGDVPLGRIVHRVASRHARRVQAGLKTTGHLFEARHHALLADEDAYLLELVRYIHLNPVRANLVADPAEHEWSSHREYLGMRDSPWVTTDFALRMFAANLRAARSAYLRFIRDGLATGGNDGLVAACRSEPRVLGDDRFLSRIVPEVVKPRARMTLDELILDCCNQLEMTPEDVRSTSRTRRLTRARAWIARRASEGRIASMSAVARALGRDESTLRELLKRHTLE